MKAVISSAWLNERHAENLMADFTPFMALEVLHNISLTI
jgi:hypothetical protein